MRRILFTGTAVLAAATLAACSGGDGAATDSATATPSVGAPAGDPDQATVGGGVPAGYMGQMDPNANAGDLANASYTVQGSQWVVRTGPRHIVYAAGDTASGSYTASATFEQMEATPHPESYGLFIGGRNLDQQPDQNYTYFLVRPTGEYMVSVREGPDLHTVRAWTASPAVPKADANGRATYRLTARVTGDAVQFLVNDQQVVSVPKASLPTDGIAGLRINHNLHLTTGPVSITRG